MGVEDMGRPYGGGGYGEIIWGWRIWGDHMGVEDHMGQRIMCFILHTPLPTPSHITT